MKRRAIIDRLDALKRSALNGVPHELTFKPTGALNYAAKKRLQEALDHSFRIWREAWILPVIEEIRALVTERPKRKAK